MKMNVYFKNQYFNNDNFLLFVFDEEESTIHTSFSRIEEYSLYKGLDRGVEQPYNNMKYANLFIRADTSKTTIKRKYQKLMEFYADSSSILIALFDVLFFIFCFVNRFYAYHSLAKQIFFFKDVENRHFDINRKYHQIKNLIKLLDPLVEKKNKLISINDNKNQSPRDSDEKNDMEIVDLEEGIKIYNINKSLRKKENNSKIDEALKPNDFRNFLNKKLRIRMNRRTKFTKDEAYEKNSKYLSTLQSAKRNIVNSYTIQPVKTSNISFKGSKAIELEKMGRIKFKYNIFEIFWSYLWNCCMTNKLKIKKDLTEKSNNILNAQLDISLYIKNSILIDILNQALINDSKKSMTKFISRPVISLSKNVERNMNQFYKNYEITDFDNLYEEISYISKKPRLTPTEQKIISLAYNELNVMV